MRYFLLIPALLFSLLGKAGTPPDVLIHSGKGMVVIGHQVEPLTDTNDLSIEQAMRSEDFTQSASGIPNLGISTAAHWVRFRLLNRTSTDRLAISIGNPEIESIDAWVVLNGAMVHHRLGQSVDPRALPEPDVEPIIPLEVPLNDHADIYIRLKAAKQLVVPISAGTKEDLRTYTSSRDLLIGSYLGFMAVLLLYNLFGFLSTKDRYYLIYVAYILLVSITQTVFIGFAKFFFWPDSIWFATQASVIFTVVTAVSANEFMTAFIQVRKYEPRLAKLPFYLYGLMAIGLLARLTTFPIEGSPGAPTAGHDLSDLPVHRCPSALTERLASCAIFPCCVVYVLSWYRHIRSKRH